jgi:glutamate-1-semialdehyde 2,1-aminomutase
MYGDPEGNKFLDYGMALRAVTLGYADDEVNEAAFEEIRKGNNLTRASLTELNAAELITSLIPSAEMVKFAKNGSNAVTAAVKLSRGYTGRRYVARCTEHPFFSFDDWFIGNTIMDKGTLQDEKKFTLQFQYNNLASLETLFDQHPNEIACVLLEPATTVSPCSCSGSYKQEGCTNDAHLSENFLHKVKALCSKHGAVFILDEMITGFRWHLQGAQKYFNIEPDLCTFGKGMANGFSVAAVAGKRDIMDLGSIQDEGKERLFLVSTTHGAEMCGLGAFIKTIELYKRDNVITSIWNYGQKLMDGMNGIAAKLGIEKYFAVQGYPCSPVYMTLNAAGEADLALRTLFSQEMIRNKVIMAWMALSNSHGAAELDLTLSAVEKSLSVYSQALEKGTGSYLNGKAVKPVFRKYN